MATDTLVAMKRWFWVLDTAVVISFAIIGRADHGFVSDLADYVRVASPFLLGLGVSIVLVQAWRWPTDLRTGLGLAVGTLLLGMLARRFIWDDGTARGFVIVATLYLIAGMVGWRLVALGIERMATRRSSEAAPELRSSEAADR